MLLPLLPITPGMTKLEPPTPIFDPDTTPKLEKPAMPRPETPAAVTPTELEPETPELKADFVRGTV